jgi:2',3'-cyclic-nucleotide 2'-phosphodiesterase (5'-nucleotidase family)
MLFSNYIPVTDDIEPDPEIEAIIEGYVTQFNGRFKAVIGKSFLFLDGSRKKVRYEETALGNFITDIMRENTGADIALINGGAIRSSIKKGNITLEDIFKVMPFANEIVLVKLTGMELMDILNKSAKATSEDEYGGFLQVSGIYIDIRGHEIETVTVGEKKVPLSSKTVYKIAIPDFLASGGDGYTQFVDCEKINTRLPLRELIVDTVRKQGMVSAQIEGRIRRSH